MKHEYANCSFCGGYIEEKCITVDCHTKNGVVFIEGVPAGVCRQCGERYYTAEVVKAMEKLIMRTVSATGTSGKKLLRFASVLTPGEAEAMEKAIEEDCERKELSE